MPEKLDKPQLSDEEGDRCGYAEAVNVTGLPVGTLYAMVARRRIPHLRLGKRLVRFSRRALVAWLAEHTVNVHTP